MSARILPASDLIDMVAARESGMSAFGEHYRAGFRLKDLDCAVVVEGIPDWRGMSRCLALRDEARLQRGSRFARRAGA